METLHQPDDTINQRYRIVTPLGQGSMGTTYEAEDLTNYQRVAIKAVSLRQATDWKILELFEREGRVLANLNYPNIPNYLDYFYVDSSQDRIFYLVRELIGGDSLANLVQRGWNLEEEKVKQIAIQVLQTLDYLHKLNPPIIHRDIKPENLIVDRSGKVFLVDFGAVQDVYRQTISLSNTFVGTLGYMAPEQLRGRVKPASDLYSLGATLVFVLTGRSPVDLPQIRMKIDFKNLVSISPQFAGWLDKMLEPMLEDRFTRKIIFSYLLFPFSYSLLLPLASCLNRRLLRSSQRFAVCFADSQLQVLTDDLAVRNALRLFYTSQKKLLYSLSLFLFLISHIALAIYTNSLPNLF